MRKLVSHVKGRHSLEGSGFHMIEAINYSATVVTHDNEALEDNSYNTRLNKV